MAITPDPTQSTIRTDAPVNPMAQWLPESPRGGRSYSSPVPVYGESPYNATKSLVNLHFKTLGPDTGAATPNERYSTSQVLPTGPHALHYQFAWISEDGMDGDHTDWFDTGWFYVKTPPE